ncbi:MAG: DUF2877 domain-containing protein [Spartobacteria bacterium]|nr:DUF2877 domain-containing protein [Spartobacteria bacterium]
MRILSSGDRIRPGAYAVKARFARSVLLLDMANRALFVVDTSIGAGPLNLVVADPNAFVAGETLAMAPPRRGRRGLQQGSGWSRHDPVPVALVPRFDSALPRTDRAKLARVLKTALPRHAPPDSLVSLFFPSGKLPRLQENRDALFRTAFAQIAAGRLAAGVRLIRGCGAGLTPAGDDFLCGWMLALRLHRRGALAREILKHARGKNPVSNAFLELSAAGRVHAAMKKLLQAPSPAHVRTVCAFGHSSGADLLCGMLFGLGYSEFRIQNPEWTASDPPF